jgi:plasmid maintenance system antidote protein VapI
VVVTADERQQRHLVQRMLEEAGLTPTMAAAQLGVNPRSIRQYLSGRRVVSLAWLLRLAALCRCSVTVHFANGPEIEI